MKPAPPVTRIFRFFCFMSFTLSLELVLIVLLQLFRSLLFSVWEIIVIVDPVFGLRFQVGFASMVFKCSSRNNATVANTTVSVRRLRVIGTSRMPNGV